MQHDVERSGREPSVEEPAGGGKPGASTRSGQVQRKAADGGSGRTGGAGGGAAYTSEMGQTHGIDLGGAPAYGAATGGGAGGSRTGGVKQATATSMSGKLDEAAVKRIVGEAAKTWEQVVNADLNLVIEFSVYGNGELFNVSVIKSVPDEDLRVREYVRQQFERLRFPPPTPGGPHPDDRVVKDVQLEVSLRQPGY